MYFSSKLQIIEFIWKRSAEISGYKACYTRLWVLSVTTERLTERDCFRSFCRAIQNDWLTLYFRRITGILRAPFHCIVAQCMVHYVYTQIYSNAFPISRTALTERESFIEWSDPLYREKSIRLLSSLFQFLSSLTVIKNEKQPRDFLYTL